MEITVLCTDRTHPVYPHLEQWCMRQRDSHDVLLTDRMEALVGGELLFLISCGQIISLNVRERYRHALVVHASDLPRGRGWSPLVWQIIEGRNAVAVTLLEADDPVDSGAIWAKRWLHFEGHELFDEINAALFGAEIELMDLAVQQCNTIKPQSQDSTEVSWYPRRKPQDSRLDPEQSLAAQFNLLRVADPDRYPAFFELHGHRYEIRIRKKD